MSKKSKKDGLLKARCESTLEVAFINYAANQRRDVAVFFEIRR